ncbi:hypothetical protein BC827DRAFT_780159 [Russula dissimulans]|nr:hypothetical protein BC827DRAFT_780159 [Russula dissimulans]
MRRIASVLSARRPDKPEGQHSPDDQPSRPAPPPSRKSSRRFFEPAHSSSASSAGSVSLRTPEDDRTGHSAPPGGRSATKKSWVPWMTPKKSDLQPQPQRPSSVWSDSLSPVPSPPTLAAPSKIIPDQQTESDEDTSEESSSSESDSPLRPPLAAAESDVVIRPLTPIAFLQAFTASNISPPFSSPPLLHYPNVPIFPRSSNHSRSLHFRGSMESVMHRNRLLGRLQRGHLTPADQRILATVGSRPPSAAERRALTQSEEGERYDLRHVRPSSLGLRQWITRPYFEERFVVWAPDDAGTVVWTTVKGSGFGVWALEVSDTLELLAGPTDVENPLPIGTLVTQSPNNSAVSSASLSAVGKQAPYKSVPSPLGRDNRPSDSPISSSSPELMNPASTSIISSSRRGVRFAEDVDKEDQIPLGYVLRHRKRREAKTLFLQREQERRQHEEEKRRHEAERQQWVQEKRQWQKEKRTMEGAKRQKQYTEEINATDRASLSKRSTSLE